MSRAYFTHLFPFTLSTIASRLTLYRLFVCACVRVWQSLNFCWRKQTFRIRCSCVCVYCVSLRSCSMGRSCCSFSRIAQFLRVFSFIYFVFHWFCRIFATTTTKQHEIALHVKSVEPTKKEKKHKYCTKTKIKYKKMWRHKRRTNIEKILIPIFNFGRTTTTTTTTSTKGV